ncbi:hypothetical protein AltI4_31030 [Alteromonas sp. I4]|nr:hypothetical protein AltI4_31030 [Alteromonas sp. I4]
MNYLNAEWPLSKWASASLASIREERHQPVDIDKFIVTVEDAVNLLHISRSTLISTIPELATKRVIPKGMRINAIDLIVNAKK